MPRRYLLFNRFVYVLLGKNLVLMYQWLGLFVFRLDMRKRNIFRFWSFLDTVRYLRLNVFGYFLFEGLYLKCLFWLFILRNWFLHVWFWILFHPPAGIRRNIVRWIRFRKSPFFMSALIFTCVFFIHQSF